MCCRRLNRVENSCLLIGGEEKDEEEEEGDDEEEEGVYSNVIGRGCVALYMHIVYCCSFVIEFVVLFVVCCCLFLDLAAE